MSGARLAVRIERVDDRFEVTVQRDDEPAVTGSFTDADRPELPPIAVDGPRAGTISLAKAGQALFELLHGAGLGEVWPAAGPAPRLWLDVRDPDLALWPWELMADPRTGRPFTSRTAPAARARLPFLPNPRPAGVPMRLLVVIGDPVEDPVLQQENEIEAIYQGLAGAPCTWHVDIVRGPEKDALYADFPDRAPDVLHVIGHGVPSWRGPAIQMKAPSGEWQLAAGDLVETITGTVPRLVVLNACRSADQPNEALPLARGLVENLLDNDVHAVVAMQGDIVSAPAATFARELYRHLSQRRPLDAAVAEARATVGNTTSYEARDWALPVLHLRADPARVLHQRVAVDPLDVINTHNGFAMVARMVDRAPQRREFRDGGGRPGEGEPRQPGLVFVTGGSRAGKTILARSCVVSHRAAGAKIVYHSLEGRSTVGTRDFLLGLVDAARRWFDAGAAARCADTETALHGLFEGNRAAEPLPTPPEPRPDDLILPSRPMSVPEPGVAGYAMVTGLLRALGGNRPVTVVLDHLGLVEDKNALVKGLLQPASQARLGKLRVVVVEQPEALVGIAGPRGVLPLDPRIAVGAFQRDDAGQLVREYLARCEPADLDRPKWETVRREVIAWATKRMGDDEPAELSPAEIEGAFALFMTTHWPAGLVAS